MSAKPAMVMSVSAPLPPPKGYTRFSTVQEVALALRVSHMTIRRLIDEGAMPAYRVGRTVRIPTAAVWQYLETNRVETPWATKDCVPARALPLAPTA